MKSIKIKKLLPAIFIYIFIMTGCATLKINVDVYKGPMINNKDVQVEQMASMAIGAKPLLINLRDELQVKYNIEYSKIHKNDRNFKDKDYPLTLEGFRGKDFYEPGFISGKTTLKGWEALRTNGILYLYEDKVYHDPCFQYLVKMGNSYFKDYESASNKLSKKDLSGLADFKKAISNIFQYSLDLLIYINSSNTVKNDLNISAINDVCSDIVDLFIDKRELEKLVDLNKIHITKNSLIKFHLRNQLLERPIETAQYLNSAHKKNSLTGVGNDFQDEKDFKELNVLTIKITNVVKTIDKLASASGLDNGRLDDGLDTLHKNYLDAHETYRKDPVNEILEKENKRTRDAFIDALIRFSEKVLFIANFDILFEGTDDSLTRQITILQTIGNSIINHADELKHNFAHENSNKNKKEGEKNAYESSLAKDPYVAFHEMMKDLSGKLSSVDTKFKDEKKRCDDVKKSKDEKDSNLLKIEKRLGPGIIFDRDNGKIEVDKEVNHDQTRVKNIPQKELADSILQNDLIKALEDILLADINAEFSEGYLEQKTDFKSFKEKFKNYVLKGIERERKNPDPSNFLKKLLSVPLVIDNLPSGETDKITDDLPGNIFKGIVRIFRDDFYPYKTDRNKWVSIIPDYKKACAALTEAQQNLNIIDSNKTKFKNAHSKIKEVVESGFFSELDNYEKKITSAELFFLLDKKLREKTSKTSGLSDHDKIPWNDAIKVLNEKPGYITRDEIQVNAKENAKDILDRLIASLRYEHIQAVRLHGIDSPISKQIKSAIKVALNQKSEMIHIRSSMAYLRNSNPSTYMQTDNELEWRNMLGKHAFKSFLFADKRWTEQDKKMRKTISAIDKQYWHNINRIKLSGAGRTNYAITKDDIGNWYIKGFSSNPTNIIKGAKSLALFGIGNKMGSNLLEKSKKGTPEDKQTQTSWREGRFKGFKKRYDETTMKTYNDLKTFMEQVSGSIKESWKNLGVKQLDEYEKVLVAPDAQMGEFQFPDHPENESRIGDIVIDQLREIFWYSRRVNSGLKFFIDKYENQESAANEDINQLDKEIETLNEKIAKAPTPELAGQLETAKDEKIEKNGILNKVITNKENAVLSQSIAKEIIQIQLEKSLSQHGMSLDNYASAVKILGEED